MLRLGHYRSGRVLFPRDLLKTIFISKSYSRQSHKRMIQRVIIKGVLSPQKGSWICSSVNFDFFIDKPSSQKFCRKTHIMSGPFLRDEVRDDVPGPPLKKTGGLFSGRHSPGKDDEPPEIDPVRYCQSGIRRPKARPMSYSNAFRDGSSLAKVRIVWRAVLGLFRAPMRISPVSFHAIIKMAFLCGLWKAPTFFVPINPPFADNSPHLLRVSAGRSCRGLVRGVVEVRTGGKRRVGGKVRHPCPRTPLLETRTSA
jgi:hypothetical protein